MKNVEVESLAIPELMVFKFSGFEDDRGYFSETFKTREIAEIEGLELLAQRPIWQVNQSYSKPHVLRGLHFQWNPYMGKLVRTVHGHMVDIVLDIRIGSPTFGKGIMYDMPADIADGDMQGSWVPPGFAPGNYFLKETAIEYFCTGDYSQGNESGISPFAPDIDWGLCDVSTLSIFQNMAIDDWNMTDNDRKSSDLSEWVSNPDCNHFIYGKCERG